MNVPMKEALRTAERSVLDLIHLCRCSHCTRSKSEDECRVAVALAIRSMVSTISYSAMDECVLPAVRGIQILHSRIYADLQKTSRPKDFPEFPLLAVAVGLEVKGMYPNEPYTHFDPLSHLVELFSAFGDHGRYITDISNKPLGSDHCTATVRRGVCYYLNCLNELSSEAENARIVHILPGHIQLGDRQFQGVYDPYHDDPASLALSPIAYDLIEEFSSTRRLLTSRSADIEIQAFAQERARDDELFVFFKATLPGEPVITLRPGFISHCVLQRTGVLTCDQDHCVSRLNLPSLLIKRGWQIPNDLHNQSMGQSSKTNLCLIWPQLDSLVRCIIIQLYSVGRHEAVFLRREQCISCFTSSVARQQKLGRQEIFHIV